MIKTIKHSGKGKTTKTVKVSVDIRYWEEDIVQGIFRAMKKSIN